MYLRQIFHTIEQLLGQDVNGRGIGPLVCPGDLEAAARSLLAAEQVLVGTGFPVPARLTGETDGPPGALAVARALEELGKRVVLVSDRFTVPLLEAGVRHWRLAARVVDYPLQGAGPALLDETEPDCLLAIERPGTAADGHYYSMRGVALTPHVAPLDPLFRQAAQRGLPTAGIGDGGNEIGMGKVLDRIPAWAPHLQPIAATTACDHLVVAGTSNWGAYGVVAGLGLLSGRNLLPSPAEEGRLLHVLVEAGAVDGITSERVPTVDRREPDELQRFLTELDQLSRIPVR